MNKIIPPRSQHLENPPCGIVVNARIFRSSVQPTVSTVGKMESKHKTVSTVSYNRNI